jgi:hypothetical protein
MTGSQLYPGAISVFRPVDAAPEATGMPGILFADIIFADTVDQALAQAVAIL